MRATNLKFMSAVSVLLLTMVCTTVPAWARVEIMANLTGEPNEVIISYDATGETNLVRAFALDIRFGNDVNIMEVTGISSDYYIYPGTIWIDAQGNVMDFGTPMAEYSDLPSGTLPGLDSNSITIEMASLYSPVGPGSPNAPAKSGDLVSIKLSGEFCVIVVCESCIPVGEEFCCITISGNVARAGGTGVVMEDPNEVVEVQFHNICDTPPPPPPECMKTSAPEYSDWQDWGEPNCWCYARQCRGDSDGLKTGPFWVAIPDLNAFRAAFNKTDLVLQGVPNGICSDFDHIKTGPFRVAIPDLNIFRLYFNKHEISVPCCPDNYVNFWIIECL
jgi:hypothetical protein